MQMAFLTTKQKLMFNLEFTCTGMKNGDKFPIEHTGRGKNISPEFIIRIYLTMRKRLLLH